MGCGASSKEYLKKHDTTDTTLPDHTPARPIKVNSLKDVVAEQKDISAVNDGTLRLAKIMKLEKIEDTYETLEVLGRGMSGSVCRARNRTSSTQVALKQINTALLTPPQRGRLYNEVHIALLMDHPNITKLYAVYETDTSLALCSEVCEGGALVEYIGKRKHLEESEASGITKQMCLAVAYMHSPSTPGGQMCHRDLKLENFMFASCNFFEPHIKLIDFGLSRICEKGSQMTLFAGSLHYYSPELLNKCYDYRCDLWALGVTVYIMIFGVPPFTVRSTPMTYQRIREGKYRIHRSISQEARDFLARLLHKDPAQRTPAQDLVEHAWITKHEGQTFQDEPTVSLEMASALQMYATNGVFKRAALKFVSMSLPTSKIADLQRTFAAMDTGHDGVVSLQEFTNALEKSFQQSAESSTSCPAPEDFKDVFGKLDLNQTETISYSEFLAACVQTKFDDDDYRALLRDVFQKFDRDHSGFIDVEDLREVLGDEYNAAKVEDLIAECDRDKDGKLSLNDFMSHLSASVAADALDPEMSDGLAGTLNPDALAIPGNDTTEIVQAEGETPLSPEGAKRGGAHAFKVVTALVVAAETSQSKSPTSKPGVQE